MANPLTEHRDQLTLVQLGGCLGCGSIILAVFLLLGWTVLRTDARVLSDPQQVDANLQAIVPCQIPPGYRGFRGINDEARKIALLAPKDYGGTRVPVDRELTIGVWTFPPGVTPAARKSEVVTFWETMTREQLGHAAGALETSAPAPTTITIAGKPFPADQRTLTARKRLKLVVALVTLGDRELGLSFIGREEGFDTKAMTAFLESLE